jgi:hypothetical protein
METPDPILTRQFNILISQAMLPHARLKDRETFAGAVYARECVELLSEAMLAASDNWTLEQYKELLRYVDKHIQEL